MSKYSQLRKEVLVKLVNRTVNIKSAIESEPDRGDCACASKESMVEDNLPDLVFENRDYELNRIADPGGPSLVVVDAPLGFGKTYLLRKIKEMYQDKYESLGQKWLCILIDLSYLTYEKRQLILDEVFFQVKNSSKYDTTISDLATAIGGQDRDILILIDAVESNEQLTRWLVKDVIPGLIERLRIPNKKVRAVFAGRYITMGGWQWPNYTPFYLSGFGTRIVQRVIQRLNPSLSNDVAAKLALLVTFLSGGHPKSIKEILWYFTSHNWAIDVNDPNEFQRIFEFQVAPTVNSIMEQIEDTEVRSALTILSIFRRFNLNTIQFLQKKRVLPYELEPLSLLTRLSQTRLVRPPTPDAPFYSDAIVRNLILVQMQFVDKERFLYLNTLANATYESWIEGVDATGESLKYPVVDEMLVIFMVESFYHLTYGFEEQQFLDRVEKILKGYIPRLKSAFGDIQLLKQLLKTKLREDEDILARMRELNIESHYHTLVESL